MSTDSQTPQSPPILAVKDIDGFKWAAQIVPEIPKIFKAMQDKEGRFVDPQFEGIMGILAIRGAVADRVLNIEDAEGEIQMIAGDLLDNWEAIKDVDSRSKLSPGNLGRTRGSIRRGQARQAYLRENVERYKLELRALKALLTGSGHHGI